MIGDAFQIVQVCLMDSIAAGVVVRGHSNFGLGLTKKRQRLSRPDFISVSFPL